MGSVVGSVLLVLCLLAIADSDGGKALLAIVAVVSAIVWVFAGAPGL